MSLNKFDIVHFLLLLSLYSQFILKFLKSILGIIKIDYISLIFEKKLGDKTTKFL